MCIRDSLWIYKKFSSASKVMHQAQQKYDSHKSCVSVCVSVCIGATTLWDPWAVSPPTLENPGTKCTQTHLVPEFSRVGGNTSHESHRVVAPTAAVLVSQVEAIKTFTDKHGRR